MICCRDPNVGGTYSNFRTWCFKALVKKSSAKSVCDKFANMSLQSATGINEPKRKLCTKQVQLKLVVDLDLWHILCVPLPFLSLFFLYFQAAQSSQQESSVPLLLFLSLPSKMSTQSNSDGVSGVWWGFYQGQGHIRPYVARANGVKRIGARKYSVAFRTTERERECERKSERVRRERVHHIGGPNLSDSSSGQKQIWMDRGRSMVVQKPGDFIRGLTCEQILWGRRLPSFVVSVVFHKILFTWSIRRSLQPNFSGGQANLWELVTIKSKTSARVSSVSKSSMPRQLKPLLLPSHLG